MLKEEEEEEGNAIYNADNIVNTTHANNEVANTSNAANANNTLWESLDLPMPPMHPTPMTNNNYSAHEQEIILGSKSFTLGTPYATQNELIRMNANKNDKNNTKNTGNKKAKVTAGKNAAGGKQAPSKAQQQKNRRQTVKAKKDAILAVDKIMADNAKSLSPPRNLLNNDARLRTTELFGSSKWAVPILPRATRTNHAEKKRENDDYGDTHDAIQMKKMRIRPLTARAKTKIIRKATTTIEAAITTATRRVW